MRLFVAIPIDPPIRDQLLQWQQRFDAGSAKIRWTRPDQFHLTLKFIGPTDDNLVPRISQTLADVARRHHPFSIRLNTADCFPKTGPVRIVWAADDEDSETLTNVTQDIEKEMTRFSVSRETRTFSLHLTIGRVKFDPTRGTLRQAVQRAPLGPCTQQVTEIILYQSELNSKGARYTVVSRAKLGPT